MILEQALEQTKQSFPVPETWVVPCADSGVGDRDRAISNMDQRSGFGHSIDQKTWVFYPACNGCNDQLELNEDLSSRPNLKSRFKKPVERTRILKTVRHENR